MEHWNPSATTPRAGIDPAAAPLQPSPPGASGPAPEHAPEHATLAAPGTALVRTRHDGWTPARQATFLRVLAATGNVSAAAREAGMTRQSAYKLRARLAGEPFPAAPGRKIVVHQALAPRERWLTPVAFVAFARRDYARPLPADRHIALRRPLVQCSMLAAPTPIKDFSMPKAPSPAQPVTWPELAFDSWLLMGEAATVMWLRSLRLMMGGPAGTREAQRMWSEKFTAGMTLMPALIAAGAAAQTAEALGAATLAHYRKPVRANRLRLSRGPSARKR